jgi:hypothetical protein
MALLGPARAHDLEMAGVARFRGEADAYSAAVFHALAAAVAGLVLCAIGLSGW